MATASNIKLSPSHRPVFAAPRLTQESADKASELLTLNNQNYDIFFSAGGFHNHIAHQILTLYALGAPPRVLQAQFNRNKGYQRPQKKADQKIVQDLFDEEHFGQRLGNGDDYINYLVFFREEIDKKGWQAVVNEYLFARTKKADDMLVRCFGGFLHPLIHLGFGIEFDQPAIIAEALAETAVHDRWMHPLLLEPEKLAKSSSGQPSKSLFELTNEGRAIEKLVKAPHDSDGNKLREGVIGRAAEEMVKLAAQYTVKPDELEAKCAEMIEYCVYYTLAAQRPDKEVKMDFFLMHDLNCSVFFPAFITDSRSSWLSPENKARLLEWKARGDLAQYFARGSPDLRIDEIKNYKPIKADASAANGHAANGNSAHDSDDWQSIFERAFKVPDDGHLAKLLRGIANGQQYCQNIAKPAMTSDMWLKGGLMSLESIEQTKGEIHWVRTTGFDSAWAEVPARAKSLL